MWRQFAKNFRMMGARYDHDCNRGPRRSDHRVDAKRRGEKVANDLFAGEWTQDLGETRLRQGLVLEIATDRSGGIRFLGDFSSNARFDGRRYDLENSRNDTVTLELVDLSYGGCELPAGQSVAPKRWWVVSARGRRCPLSTTGTLETGQRLTEKLLFKKQ